MEKRPASKPISTPSSVPTGIQTNSADKPSGTIKPSRPVTPKK